MISEPVLEWMSAAFERSDYEAFMQSNIERMSVQGLSELDAAILKEDGRNTPKRVSKAEFEMVNHKKTWEDLKIHCPTTILHTNNPLWDEAYIEWLETIAPGFRLVEWKDAGHFVSMQYPERLAQLIRAIVE